MYSFSIEQKQQQQQQQQQQQAYTQTLQLTVFQSGQVLYILATQTQERGVDVGVQVSRVAVAPVTDGRTRHPVALVVVAIAEEDNVGAVGARPTLSIVVIWVSIGASPPGVEKDITAACMNTLS